MRSNYIQNYECKLVESAVENNNMNHAIAMKENNISRDIILDVTGIDINEI